MPSGKRPSTGTISSAKRPACVRRDGALVAAQRPLVHLAPGDVELLAQPLGALAAVQLDRG